MRSDLLIRSNVEVQRMQHRVSVGPLPGQMGEAGVQGSETHDILLNRTPDIRRLVNRWGLRDLPPVGRLRPDWLGCGAVAGGGGLPAPAPPPIVGEYPLEHSDRFVWTGRRLVRRGEAVAGGKGVRVIVAEHTPIVGEYPLEQGDRFV